MGLRLIHLVFVACCVVLTAFVAAWAAGVYLAEHKIIYAVGALVSLACGAGLVVYGARFQRKTRNLS